MTAAPPGSGKSERIALPQGDGGARPAFAGGTVGGECNLVSSTPATCSTMLPPSAVPRIAEGEVRPRYRHHPFPKSSSASRFTAGRRGGPVGRILRGITEPGLGLLA